jgi:hypothetical protein
VAVENGKYRALNDVEEAEFQKAMYGTEPVHAKPAEQGILIQVSAFIRIQLEPKS